ncbi:MAG: hypothetical protein E6R03_08450 [Hyphomicrobiaceae bacterium]|nr:MAG: hypothetical protein E6R03_08450 [Hyphomicrobiaceae bacterium]
MKSVTLIDQGVEITVAVLTKAEIAVILAVPDKNPRSQWVWFDVTRPALWLAAADRVLRAKGDGILTPPQRVSTKAIKDTKALKDDLVCVWFPHPDVAEILVIRKPKAAKGEKIPPLAMDNGTDLSSFPLVERVRVSVAPVADTDYLPVKLDEVLAANDGAAVPHATLTAADLDVLVKLADVGTGLCPVKLAAGRGETPVLWSCSRADVRWTYGMMDHRG